MTTESSVGVHSTRQPTEKEQSMIDDILMLYQLKPNNKAYDHYTENAEFHDPVSIAKGLESIRSQFNGMPKLFAESETRKSDVLADSPPNTLAINLDQLYVFKSPIPFKSKGSEQLVNSKVTLHLDENQKIVKHDEEWDHQTNKTAKESGFMGKVMEARKKVDAKIVERMVSSDPWKV